MSHGGTLHRRHVTGKKYRCSVNRDMYPSTASCCSALANWEGFLGEGEPRHHVKFIGQDKVEVEQASDVICDVMSCSLIDFMFDARRASGWPALWLA